MPLRAPLYTVAGSTVAALVGYSKSRGVDLTPDLKKRGLKFEELVKPDCRVAVETAEAMWELSAERIDDPDFALRFAECLDLDGFHLIGHLSVSSSTVGQAIDRIVEFSRLLHDAGRTEVERQKDRVFLFPGCRGLPKQPPRQIAEFNTASAVILIRFISGRPEWKPLEVHFHHCQPADLKKHKTVFGLTPTFGEAEDVIVLSAADLKMPVRVSSPSSVGAYLEGYARTLLAQLPEKADDLRDQVLRAIISHLQSGGLTIEEAAKRFSMTARTLQRRLAASGTSFSELIDEARMTTAEHFLKDHRFSQGEISFLLGFNEPSAFHKAFRRWKGISPGEWREQLSRPAN